MTIRGKSPNQALERIDRLLWISEFVGLPLRLNVSERSFRLLANSFAVAQFGSLGAMPRKLPHSLVRIAVASTLGILLMAIQGCAQFDPPNVATDIEVSAGGKSVSKLQFKEIVSGTVQTVATAHGMAPGKVMAPKSKKWGPSDSAYVGGAPELTIFVDTLERERRAIISVIEARRAVPSEACQRLTSELISRFQGSGFSTSKRVREQVITP